MPRFELGTVMPQVLRVGSSVPIRVGSDTYSCARSSITYLERELYVVGREAEERSRSADIALTVTVVTVGSLSNVEFTWQTRVNSEAKVLR